MQKFTIHTGIAAPLLRDNIDTDAIIPSREMKTVSKQGLGVGLFAAWRYVDEKARTPNSEFVLNQADYQGASIILSGKNFGCGSSREHAVWALKDYGIRCIIASSFGAIFARNCVRNGILPLELSSNAIEQLAEYIATDPQRNTLTVDLPACLVKGAQAQQYAFEIPETDRELLSEGLDQIALTLKKGDSIANFTERDQAHRPWLY